MHYVERPRPAVVFRWTSSTVLSKNAKGAERFRILYGGREVAGAILYVVEVRNTGNVPVYPKDIDSDPTFDFGASQIIVQPLVSKAPAGQTRVPQIRSTRGKLSIAPFWLDVGDSFRVDMLVINATFSDLTLEADVTGHIMGVGEVKDVLRADQPGRGQPRGTGTSITVMAAVLVAIPFLAALIWTWGRLRLKPWLRYQAQLEVAEGKGDMDAQIDILEKMVSFAYKGPFLDRNALDLAELKLATLYAQQSEVQKAHRVLWRLTKSDNRYVVHRAFVLLDGLHDTAMHAHSGKTE